METNIIFGVPFNSPAFYCFVFGATLAQYNMHYLAKKTGVAGSERLKWSNDNKLLQFGLLLLGVLLIIISLFGFHLHHFIILLFFGVISILYSFPFLPFKKKRRIKDYGFLKIITLALLWTLVTVWFPLNELDVDNNLFIFVFVMRFIFMFVLCLLFDVRDIVPDRTEHIETLAVKLGRTGSYHVCYFLMIAFTLLTTWQYFYYPITGIFISMIVSAAITILFIDLSRREHSDFFFLAGIDGMMALQALLVFVFGFKNLSLLH